LLDEAAVAAILASRPRVAVVGASDRRGRPSRGVLLDLLAAGLDAVKGDVGKRKEIVAAMEKVKIDSPRGAWTMSKAHNPVQDIYLRKVIGRENKFVGIAHKALADPARGCKM